MHRQHNGLLCLVLLQHAQLVPLAAGQKSWSVTLPSAFRLDFDLLYDDLRATPNLPRDRMYWDTSDSCVVLYNEARTKGLLHLSGELS